MTSKALATLALPFWKPGCQEQLCLSPDPGLLVLYTKRVDQNNCCVFTLAPNQQRCGVRLWENLGRQSLSHHYSLARCLYPEDKGVQAESRGLSWDGKVLRTEWVPRTFQLLKDVPRCFSLWSSQGPLRKAEQLLLPAVHNWELKWLPKATQLTNPPGSGVHARPLSPTKLRAVWCGTEWDFDSQAWEPQTTPNPFPRHRAC